MPQCAITVATKIAKKVRLHPKTTLFLLAASLFSLVSFSSTLPTSADSTPSYKYDINGTVINANGGDFGGGSGGLSESRIFKLDSTQSTQPTVDKSRTYTTQIDKTYEYNDHWYGWTGIGDDSANCQISLKISVNSDLKTGSISVTGTKDSRENSTACSDLVATFSDFNQSNISISGDSGTPVNNLYIITINVDVNRTVSKDGIYQSKVILLDINKNNTQIAAADTNSIKLNNGDQYYIDNPDGASVPTYTKFSNVISGKYKVCLDNNKDVCSDTVNVTDASNKTAIINVPSEVDPGIVDDGTKKSSCAIPGGTGWIVCPVVNFLAWTADGAFNLLQDNFLVTNPEILGDKTESAWRSIRDIANIAFVIAFMIIIFSQMTSIGITNYGIKKLLPRIVIAAILVNLSFFICQIAVDISNTVGSSARSFIEGAIPNDVIWTSTKESTTFHDLSGGILAGTLLVGAGVTLAYGASLMLFVPLILGILAAIAMTLFILIARQAIIILLVVMSPLAFVAFLLPNTQDWFQKWKKLFMAMLLLYPIIAIIYGASNLASGILAGVFAGTMGQIIAAAVLVIPLFTVPSILKKSLDSIPALGALASKWTDKATGMSGRAAGSIAKTGALAGRYGDMKDFSERQRQVKLAKGRANPGRLISTFGGSGYVEHANKKGLGLEDQEFEEGVTSASIPLKEKSFSEIMETAKSTTVPEVVRTAAIREIMKKGGYDDRRELYASSSTASPRGRTSIESGFYAAGDQKVLGSSYGGTLKDGKDTNGNVVSESHLENQLIKQITEGNINAEALMDEKLINHIIELNKANRLTQPAKDNLFKSAHEALNSPILRTKITPPMREKLDKEIYS